VSLFNAVVRGEPLNNIRDCNIQFHETRNIPSSYGMKCISICETIYECDRQKDELHWLPVSQRIEFKVAALTYKIRSTSRPAYLHSLLSNHISGSTATLRSASRLFLYVPRTRTVYGSRAFSVAAPTLWNSLPADITKCCIANCF